MLAIAFDVPHSIENRYIFFLVISIAFTLGSVFQLIKTARNEHLEKTNKSLEERVKNQISPLYISQSYIAMIYRALRFSPYERITLFKYDKSTNSLVVIGRYSENRSFAEKARLKYPVDKGCIGKAWALGRYEVDPFPDYDTEKEEYIKQSKDVGLSKTSVEKLSMKSRVYYGSTIKTKELASKSIGVIVFETVKEKFPNDQTGSSIQEALETSPINDILPWIIEASPVDFPDEWKAI